MNHTIQTLLVTNTVSVESDNAFTWKEIGRYTATRTIVGAFLFSGTYHSMNSNGDRQWLFKIHRGGSKYLDLIETSSVNTNSANIYQYVSKYACIRLHPNDSIIVYTAQNSGSSLLAACNVYFLGLTLDN